MAEINYIEINAENRSITIPQSEKLLGVENDSKAIRKYFRCPKIVGDGIDLTNPMCISTSRMHQIRYPEKTDTMPRI